MQPISALLALIPQPYRQFVELAFALIAIASMITGVLPASASKNPVVKLIRLIGGVVHSDEPGSIKIPMTNIVLRIGVSGGPGSGASPASGSGPSPSSSSPAAPSLRRVMLDGAIRAALAALMLCAASCSGSQAVVSAGAGGTVSPDGTLTWQAGVSVAINFAHAVIPSGLRSALESQPGVSAEQRAQIDRGTALTGDSLAILGTGWDSYVHHPSGSALCQAHVYLENAIASALQTLQLLKDAGIPVPPVVAAALGALGPAADMLLPPCGSAPSARMMSSTEMIRAHLEHLGAR